MVSNNLAPIQVPFDIWSKCLGPLPCCFILAGPLWKACLTYTHPRNLGQGCPRIPALGSGGWQDTRGLAGLGEGGALRTQGGSAPGDNSEGKQRFSSHLSPLTQVHISVILQYPELPLLCIFCESLSPACGGKGPVSVGTRYQASWVWPLVGCKYQTEGQGLLAADLPWCFVCKSGKEKHQQRAGIKRLLALRHLARWGPAALRASVLHWKSCH